MDINLMNYFLCIHGTILRVQIHVLMILRLFQIFFSLQPDSQPDIQRVRLFCLLHANQQNINIPINLRVFQTTSHFTARQPKTNTQNSSFS
jgi:hypothetical protein